MASYLERYISGQYEAVWDELFALGDDLREGPLYQDALAVARETMRRVKHNIELLIPRLVRVGYRFGYDWLIQPPIDEPYDTLDYQRYLDALQWVQRQPPVYTPAAQRDEQYAGLIDIFGQEALTTPPYDAMFHYLPTFQMKDVVQELDTLVGGLPLSVFAWYEQVGSVNFIGWHPQWIRSSLDDSFPFVSRSLHTGTFDPLFIEPLTEERMQYFREQGRKLDFLNLAPDLYFKHHISGGSVYGVRIPSGAADAIFQWDRDDQTFVQYLRLCFQGVGFPGRDQVPQPLNEHIAQLTLGFLGF